MTDTTKNDKPTAPTREQIADEVSGITIGSGYYSTTIGIDAAKEVADAVLALFSQPSPSTPSTEPDEVIPVADTSSGEHRKVLLYEGDDLPVCDTCTNILGLNVRWDHAEKRHAEPPRIEDMAPGTTFRARTKDGVLSAVDRLWFVDATGYVFSIGAHHIDGQRIDPSTIRDITPPPALPNQEDAH